MRVQTVESEGPKDTQSSQILKFATVRWCFFLVASDMSLVLGPMYTSMAEGGARGMVRAKPVREGVWWLWGGTSFAGLHGGNDVTNTDPDRFITSEMSTKYLTLIFAVASTATSLFVGLLPLNADKDAVSHPE
ncbi:hypothetical protein ARMGADRAFT_1072565 [Armillaria gallica]|uniref:Uncharacterized protein n=1 Tax=Armillaria gallica TaxID=47427 RepID=A0A2H3EMD5_ARMGA|nr:hypothetical protein ARMGADRAFT_1072565 [Armillaria gallica]